MWQAVCGGGGFGTQVGVRGRYLQRGGELAGYVSLARLVGALALAVGS